MRSADVTQDPRYGGKLAVDDVDGGGMPQGHPKVRSYLAVPVVSRSGTDHGAILLGHPDADRFGERHETLVRGLAAQAAVAMDNAHLFEARAAAEARQRVLIDELNHRVKNMLATVKAVLRLSARSATDVDAFTATFTERLSSLAATHTILTDGMRQTAALHQLLEAELAPYAGGDPARVVLAGPDVELSSRIAVPLGMAFHELATNAAKHGALSGPSGRLNVSWRFEDGETLVLHWLERGGPPTEPPTRQGFGSQLLQRVLVMQLGARCDFDYGGAGSAGRDRAVPAESRSGRGDRGADRGLGSEIEGRAAPADADPPRTAAPEEGRRKRIVIRTTMVSAAGLEPAAV